MDLNCGELQQEVEHKVDTLAYCNIGCCVQEMEVRVVDTKGYSIGMVG